MRWDLLARNHLVLLGKDRETAVPTRILRNAPSRDLIILFDCLDPKAFPVRYSSDELHRLSLSLAPSDPFHAPAIPDEDIEEDRRKLRDRRWELVRDLLEGVDGGPGGLSDFIFDRSQRGRLVRQAWARTGVTPPTYYDLLKRFWRGGQHPNALLPGRRAKGGPYVPPHDGSRPGRPSNDKREAARRAFDRNLLGEAVGEFTRNLQLGERPKTAHANATTKVYGEMMNVDGREARVLPAAATHVPSVVLLQYYRKKLISDVEVGKAFTPRRAWNRDNRARTGTALDQDRGPGKSYEIDATQWPVNLRSQLVTGDTIGMATLYFVIDRYSQAYAGFHVTLDSENTRGAMMALANACMNKVEYLQTLGIEITEDQWPIHHVPAELVTDRGAAFTSKLMEAGAGALIVTPTHTPSREPYHKAFVENSFHRGEQSLLHRRIPTPDGGTKSPDHALDGMLTLPALRKIIAYEILSLNQNTQVKEVPADYASVDGTKPTLLELWRSGVMQFGAPSVRSTADVEKALLPRVDFVWTDKGLRLDGTELRYRFAEAQYDDLLVRRKGNKAEKWKGMIYPDNVAKAYLFLPDGRTTPLTLAKSDAKRFAGWTSGEVQEQKDRGAANQPAKRDRLNHGKSLTRARQQHVVDDEVEAAGEVVATLSVASRDLRNLDDPARMAFRPRERRAAEKAAASKARVEDVGPSPSGRLPDAVGDRVQDHLARIFDDD